MDILTVLKANSGSFVSGEELGRQAGITRAGIWKQIEQLRAVGYDIDSLPHKGYCLTGLTGLLLPAEVRDGLVTSSFGQTVYHANAVDSTNTWAKQLASDGAPEGTLVLAEIQHKGRGRLGRSWDSPEGRGIWMTLILRPRISSAHLAGLTLLTAVSLARAVYQVTGIQAEIKWPNDLVYQGKKLVGILAEMSGEADMVHYIVMGIGLNVNQLAGDFPAELLGKATSLRMISGMETSRKRLLQEFLVTYETAYTHLERDGLKEIITYACEHSGTLGREVTVSQGFGKSLHGKAFKLDEDGSLWLETADGPQRIYAGDIIEKTEDES
jgi:BirA family biotin operon repressor/biotin-[acetyl-CoA-carboxylase] ligase